MELSAVTFGSGWVNKRVNTGSVTCLRCWAARPCRSRSGSSLSRCSLRGRHTVENILGATGASPGIQEWTPGALPKAVWSQINTLRPPFPGSAEPNRRLFVPLQFLGKAESPSPPTRNLGISHFQVRHLLFGAVLQDEPIGCPACLGCVTHCAARAAPHPRLCPNRQTGKVLREAWEWRGRGAARPALVEKSPFPLRVALEFIAAHGLGVSDQAARRGPAPARTVPGRAHADRRGW